MPRHKAIPKLEELCLVKFSNLCARTCTQLEVSSSSTEQKALFSACLRRLPSILLEELLPRVVKSMAASLRRQRAHKGLLTALECLPQSTLTKLDLASLFADVRLIGSTNMACKSLLTSVLADLPRLTKLTLVSKCNDAMLFQLARHCPHLEKLSVPMSDVTDRGVAALCGLSWEGGQYQGCEKLQELGVHNCLGVSVKGAACALRHLEKLCALSYDKLADAIETLAKIDGDFLKGKRVLNITHLDQFSDFYDFDAQPDTLPIIQRVCPNVNSLRFYVSDRGCACLAVFPDIRHLQIETDDLGDGFSSLVSKYNNLASLQLTFRSMSYEHLTLLAESCPSLAVLRLIGFDVRGSQALIPSSKHFQSLKVLDMRMVKKDEFPFDEDEDEEEDLGDTLTPELINYFVVPAQNLEELTINGVASFFSKSFMLDMFNKNPLTYLKKLVISVSQSSGLNGETARAVIACLPELSIIGLSRWKIQSKELTTIIKEIKAQNYDITLV